MNTQEFANSIRTKYKDAVASDGRKYSDIPDAELVSKIVEKYPVYKTQITDFNQTVDNTLTPAKPTFMSNLKESFTGGLSKIKSGFKTIQKGAVNKDLSQGATEQVRGALGIASGAISSAFSPLTATAQTGLQKTGIDKPVNTLVTNISDKIANIPSIQKFAMQNPNAEEVISDLINVIGSAYAPETAKGASKITQPVAGELFQKTGKFLQNTAKGGLEKAEQKNILSVVRDVMPIENKETRINALSSATPESNIGKGGVARKGILKTVEIQPTQADLERGNVAYKFIKGEKDPINKIQKLNKGIETISSQVDRTFDENPVNANFEDMIKYIEKNNVPSVNIQKDTTAFESYQRSSANALNTLYDTMKSSAKESGDFSGNLSVKDVRKARQKVDAQIKRELGDEVFNSPQYKGIKSAEVSVRNVINRLSEDLVRYPNQLEKLNKMNDFIAEAKSRGIEIDRNSPETMLNLERQFNLIKTPQSEALANKINNSNKEMSYLYEGKDNLVDKYQNTIGDNVVTKALDRVGKLVGTKNQGVQTLVSLGILGGAGALASTALPLTLASGAGYLLYRGGKWIVSPQVRKAIGQILETSGNKLNPADKKILEKLSGKDIPNKQGGFIKNPLANIDETTKSLLQKQLEFDRLSTDASNKVRKFASSNGIISDSVKDNPDYIKANIESKNALNNLQKFNQSNEGKLLQSNMKKLDVVQRQQLRKSLSNITDTTDTSLIQEAKKYKSAEGFVKTKIPEKDIIVPKENIKVYRGEGKGIGNTTLVKGRYFAETPEFASTFGNVSEFTIPKGAKIFNLDSIKKGDSYIPKEWLVDPDKLTNYLLDKGFEFTKNTNSRGVEYVRLGNTVDQLVNLIKRNNFKTKSEFLDYLANSGYKEDAKGVIGQRIGDTDIAWNKYTGKSVKPNESLKRSKK